VVAAVAAHPQLERLEQVLAEETAALERHLL
jgi:hypothetical protein